MKEKDIKKILEENEKLKKENQELNQKLQKLELDKNPNANALSDDEYFSLDSSSDVIEKFDKLNKDNNEEIINFIKDTDMSIISFLARSDKRVEILKSLSQGNKIPSVIGKEIGDSSHHVSKYLATLKEKELVVCLNENDKRFRFYKITPKGKHYLNIVENKKY